MQEDAQKKAFFGMLKKPKMHNSFLAYETSGLVSFFKKPEDEKPGAPNSAHESPPFFGPLTPPIQPKTRNTLRFQGTLPKIVV